MNITKRSSMMVRLVAVFSIVMMFTMYFVGATFAKYASTGSGTGSATVAQFSPSFNVENIDVSGIQKPGDKTENLPFTVQNYTEDKTSGVNIKYKIVVKTTGNLPLKFSIFNSEGTPVVAVAIGEKTYEYENDAFVFSPGVNETHSYTLKVEWPGENNDAQFAGLTDAVYLSVVWEQVD